MSETESLRRWGTVAFDLGFMRRTIGVGRPVFGEQGEFLRFTTSEPCQHEPHWYGNYSPACTLNVAVWYSFVPEAYRAQVSEDAIMRVLSQFLLKPATRANLDAAVMALYAWIVANVERV